MASLSPSRSPGLEERSDSPHTPTGRNNAIPDENDDADLPLTMAASVVLTALPTDAKSALENAGYVGVDKGMCIQLSMNLESITNVSLVTIHFRPISSAPLLPRSKFQISSSQHFSTVIRFLRRKLGIREAESIFCYINSTFAPGLDESVGNLWRVSIDLCVLIEGLTRR